MTATTASVATLCEVNPRLRSKLASSDLVAFVGMADVDATAAVAIDSEQRPYSAVAKAYTPFENGDILVAKITPCFENGKIAQASVSTGIAFGSTEFHVLRPGTQLDRRYLLHFLRRPSVLRLGEQRMTGAGGQRRVPSRLFDELEIPLLPLEEQRRIASILDAADALRSKRRQALEKLDTLTQSIFIDMFGEATRERVELQTLVDFVGGGTPSKARPDYYEGSICWATSKDMKGRFLIDTQDHITSEAIAASSTRLVLPGTVLVVVKSKVLAHRLPVVVAKVSTCFGQDLKGLVPKQGVQPEFVASALRANQRWLLSRARGVNTEGLTLEELRPFPVPEATAMEMREFQHRANAVEKSSQQFVKTLEHSDALFSGLQHRAFRGEL